MLFNDLSRMLLGAPDPLLTFTKLQPQIHVGSAKKTEIMIAVDALDNAIKKRRPGRALAAARALLLLAGPEKTMEGVRRIHALRASHHGFNNTTSLALILDWTKHSAVYGWNPAQLQYLESTRTLWTLAPALNRMQRSLVQRLKAKRPHAIKTLLAIVDTAFAYPHQADRLASTDTMHAYTCECMAQAFSYLLGLYHKEVGLSAIDVALVDEAATLDSFYDRLLIDAAKLCEYLEVEVLIEGFPYIAFEHNGFVRIRSVDPALERSVRLGYIQTEFQQLIRGKGLSKEQKNSEKSAESLLRVAQEFYTHTGNRFVTFKRQPIARYVMWLPLGTTPLQKLFASDALYLEDMAAIESLGTEDYVEPALIVHTSVVGDITVLDIQKIQRFFYFLHQGMQHALDGHYPAMDRPSVRLSSCIPTFRRADLVNMIEMIVGIEKAQPLLSLLTCKHSADYADIQYAPVIACDDWYMLPVTVASLSNLVRNILCQANRRLKLHDGNGKDPMEAALVSAFHAAGFLVSHNQNLRRHKANRLETDVVAYRDGHLFLIECKNGFHPCNVYELRNSFNHIVDGAEQLRQRKEWMTDVNNQKWLFEQFGWPVSPDAQVHTCIAIGNRVFNGYRLSDHPVRQTHELLNLLREGIVDVNHTVFRLWKNEQFCVEDLCAYLDGSIIIDELVRAMEPVTRQLDFDGVGLILESYALDSQKLASIVEKKYPRKPQQTL